MRALMRKLIADLAGRRWQAALILITVAAAAGLLYVGLVSLGAATAPFDRLLARTNGPHAWFMVRDTPEGRALAERFRTQPGVLADMGLRPVAVSQLTIPGEETSPAIYLTTLGEAKPAVGDVVIVAGRGLEPGDSEGALLNATLAHYFAIQPGDRVAVSTPAGERSLTVVGLQAESTTCAYPNCLFVNLYVLPDTLAEITAGRPDMMLQTGIRLADPADAAAISNQVNREPEAWTVRGLFDWQTMRQITLMISGVGLMFIMAFGVMAVIAAAMITANIVGGAVLGQYKEIGVLKALGFTRAQVLSLFAGQMFLLALPAGALGTLGGHWLAAGQMTSVAMSMGDPDLLRYNWPVAGGVVAAVLAVTIIVAVLAAWGGAAVRPAAVLADGFSAPGARPALLVRGLAALRLPGTLVLGAKDALARRGRAAMTVLSLALCLTTISMSIANAGISSRVASDLGAYGINFDLAVDRGQLSVAEAEAAVAAMPEVERAHTMVALPALSEETSILYQLNAVDGPWAEFEFHPLEGRMPEAAGEVVLAAGLWDRLKVNLGDRISAQVGGRILSLTVVGKYRNLMNMGMESLTPLETVRQVLPEVTPDSLRVKLKPGTDAEAVRRALLKATGDRLQITVVDISMMKMILDQVALARLFSLIMAVIALVSVLNSALLTAREQMREAGIRKAIGMTPAQILGAAAFGGALLGLLGGGLGAPAGVWLSQSLVDVLSDMIGLGPMTASLQAADALLLVAGGAVLAALASLPAALLATRLTTAQVLHAE